MVTLIEETAQTETDKTQEKGILLGLARNLGIVLSAERVAFLLSTKGAVAILRKADAEDPAALKLLLGTEKEIACFLHQHHPQLDAAA